MLEAIWLGLQALLVRFGEQLVLTLGIQGAVSAINSLLGGSDGGVPYPEMSNDVMLIYEATAVGTYSTEALFFEIQANQTALMAAINGIISGASPVTVSSGSVGDVANEVLYSSLIGGTSSLSDLVQPAGQLASFTLGYLLPFPGGQYWSVASIPPNGSLSWSIQYPVLDISTATLGEGLLAAVLRQNPTAFVTYSDCPGGHVSCILPATTTIFEWVTNLDEQQYYEIVSYLFPAETRSLAPVWPGIANVTLGTPVALAAGVTVTGPLDGVLVSITSTPSYTGLFDFDGDPSYRNVGAITFQSDNGQDELPQTLGFASAIYCPRQMATASLAKIRTPGAIVGTVTPWTHI